MSPSKSAQDLQILEHNIQHVLMQKQSVELELNEVLNAIGELEKTKDEVYRVMGGIMLRADKATLAKELGEKKRVLELRVSAFEKQEHLLESQLETLKKLHIGDGK